MRIQRYAPVYSVEDVPAARDFFVRHLGCTVLVDLGWYVDLGHPDLPGFTVDLVAAGHDANPPGLGAVAGSVLALVVADVRAEQERLAEAGVEVLAPWRDEPWGQRHCYLRSPGPVVELVQQIEPDARWLAANGL